MVEAEEEGTIEDKDLAMDWNKIELRGAFPIAHSFVHVFLIGHRFGSREIGTQTNSSNARKL